MEPVVGEVLVWIIIVVRVVESDRDLLEGRLNDYWTTGERSE